VLAQIVLTPAESKKLIAKAIANMDIVRRAATEGTVVLHPSSSTYFIVEELTGAKPQTSYWVCGVVAPRGNCIEMGIIVGDYLPRSTTVAPEDFQTWWTIRNGQLSIGEKVSEIMKQVKPTDVFVKGVNALDPEGNVGILIGDPIGGGPLGRILHAWRKLSFNLVFPVGLEKLIPIPISQASKEAKQTKYDYAMGLATGLLPCPRGEKVNIITEIDAIQMLSGAVGIPIAAGGLGGAEGAITMVVKGSKEQVKRAIDYVEQSKGAKLAQLRLCDCRDCPAAHCGFPVADKHWA
jgi:hypothetical protein